MGSGGGLVKIAGVDKERLREFLDIDVSDEDWREFTSRRNGALLGVDIANDRNMGQRYVWEEGREFAMADFGGLTLHMAGTFTPEDPTLRSVILTGDAFLQEADDRRGVANQILVRVADRDETARISEEINSMPAQVKLHTESMQVALDQAIADLDDMLRYAGHVIVLVTVVILLGLANATSMSVRDRTQEVGVLRSLGFSRRRITALVAGESLALAVLGGALGCGAAWIGLVVRPIPIQSGSFLFPVEMTPAIAIASVGAAAVVGLLGSLPAGIAASRRSIVESLRSVD